MTLSTWQVRIELGGRRGGSPNGVWESNTRDVFYTNVQAMSPQDAERMTMMQYGGPDRCRVSIQFEVK